jgi:hypothetical protein
MSNSRALVSLPRAKKMVQEMGIPFIDLFGAYYLSCSWTSGAMAISWTDSIEGCSAGSIVTVTTLPRHCQVE